MGNFIGGLIYLGQWHGGLLVYIKIGVCLLGYDHIVTLPTMGPLFYFWQCLNALKTQCTCLSFHKIWTNIKQKLLNLKIFFAEI